MLLCWPPRQDAFGVFAMTFGAPLAEPLEKAVEAEFATGAALLLALRPLSSSVTALVGL